MSKELDGCLETASAAVKKLYEFRDSYFDHHSLEKASQKIKDVDSELEKTLKTLSEVQSSCERSNKAQFYLLKGKALNIKSDFDDEAFECLTKAAKLNPKNVETWNELGECYWKKGNVSEAKNCFQRGLERDKNKISLRNLSMVLRQEATKTAEEKKQNVVDSLSKAKEATELDLSDGASWTVLGNAYLTSFFSVAQNPDTLRKSLTAYQKAEKDPAAKNSADLHFNRAVAQQYEEDYQSALSGYSMASILDPGWALPKNKEAELINYLNKVQDCIVKKGGIKPKRLRNMISAISTSQLGPYSGGSYKSPSGKSVVKLAHVDLNELVVGLNSEKVLLGKVISFVYSENNVPLTLCLADRTGEFYAVSVYNLAGDTLLRISDSVAIPEPYLTQVSLEYKGSKFNFKSIRVVIPLVLVVNGKKLGQDSVASIEVSVTNLTL